MAEGAKPRVAAIITEYRDRAHADVIVTKLLEGYDLYGVHTDPRVEVASIYLDQTPANDMGVAMAAKHGVPIFDTIGEALSLGGSGIAVDGVLLIGEHGAYPINELGQKLYPRRRFFDAAVSAMTAGGRIVPLFNDKHLSWSFADARRMYDTARRLGIPFLAGSSIPVAWRVPRSFEVPMGTPIEEAVAVGYGPLEAYGYHALEALQCMVERRAGGEQGVRSVQHVSGDALRQAADGGRWDAALADAAMLAVAGPERAAIARTAIEHAFLIEYIDGLKATVLMCAEGVADFSFAARSRGETFACRIALEPGPPYGHFTFLTRQIESLVLTGVSPYPVERTLLTTGMIDAVMRSRHESSARLETPELAIAYEPVIEVPDTGVNAEPPFVPA